MSPAHPGLERLIGDWLPRQRWFATKSSGYDALSLHSLGTVIESENGRVEAVLARVDSGDTTQHYFLPLAWHRSSAAEREHALIGAVDGWLLHDGAVDPTTNAAWLRLIAEGSPVGELQPGPKADLPDEAGRALGAEQSNTSIVYGDVICKVFRRLAPTPNPDLEVTRRLGELGSTSIAPALGWLEGAGFTLAIVQPFLRGASEGWALALTSVRDLYAMPEETAADAGGDFAPEAERLGAATARLHAELRAAFGVRTSPGEAARMAAQMRERLDAAVVAVPALARVAAGVRAVYDAVAGIDDPLDVQRIHGDYHLGQVLRTQDGWVILDFEGEPARPVEERTAPMSPLRDVAGMLRSFDYAARHLLADHERSAMLDLRASEWAGRNRAAFCDGYAAESGADPRQSGPLLRAMELDKAVYEVRYEADHRPTWVDIPLGAIGRLASLE
ncbi:MAG: maltokinase [Frankiales bacterium]|nr:maltokinase [Frankiales bacterium]